MPSWSVRAALSYSLRASLFFRQRKMILNCLESVNLQQVWLERWGEEVCKMQLSELSFEEAC